MDDFGSGGVTGGSDEMVEGPGRGQLRAWQGLGRVEDQGPGGLGADFGHFGP